MKPQSQSFAFLAITSRVTSLGFNSQVTQFLVNHSHIFERLRNCQLSHSEWYWLDESCSLNIASNSAFSKSFSSTSRHLLWSIYFDHDWLLKPSTGQRQEQSWTLLKNCPLQEFPTIYKQFKGLEILMRNIENKIHRNELISKTKERIEKDLSEKAKN